MSDNRELTLFDVADWLWSYRLLALAMLVIAGGWAAISVLSTPRAALSQQYEVHVQIYPSGSPLRGAEDIANIIIEKLEKTRSVELISPRSRNPLIFEASGASQAETAVQGVLKLNEAFVAEVSDRVALVEPVIGTNEAALAPYLQGVSFLAAIDDDLFELVTPESARTSSGGASLSLARAVMFPVIVCGSAFFVLALVSSFVRAWRQRKIHRENSL